MKQLLPPANATFAFAAKTITFATTIPSTISHILHVTNITRGVIYYQPQAGSTFTGTYASPVLTLACSTAGHADADKLEIFYDDNVDASAVTGTVAATQSGTWDEVGINDSGNSITVDYATTGSGTSAGALRVELPTNGTGVIATVGAVTAITNALPAGTNAIGKLAANSGVDIGDVDVTSLPALPTGSNVIGHVITDTGSTTAVTGSVAVTNAGTFVVQENGAALTALQLIDDTVKVLGTDTYTEAATKGSVIGAVRRDADTTLVDTTNEVAPLQVNATGDLKVAQILPLPAGTNAIGKLAANSGVDIGDVDVTSAIITSGTITTVSTVTNLSQMAGTAISMNTGVRDAGTQRVTIATNDAVPITDNSGAITVDWAGTAPPIGAGTEAAALRVTVATNSTGLLPVSQATASNLNAQVVGSVADDVAAAGNPVQIGVTARQTNRTAVTDGDTVRAAADDMGRQVVVMGQVRDLIDQQHTQIASSSAETTIVTAIASTFNDLVQLVLTNQTATAVNATIKDSTAGTTRMIIALAASGGAVIPFARPIPQATVNTAWTCTLSSAAVTVNIFALYEKNV